MPYLLAESVKGREALHNFSALLKRCLVPDIRGVTTLRGCCESSALRKQLFHIMSLLIGILFFPFIYHSAPVTTSTNEETGHWVRDLLKCHALRPF